MWYSVWAVKERLGYGIQTLGLDGDGSENLGYALCLGIVQGCWEDTGFFRPITVYTQHKEAEQARELILEFFGILDATVSLKDFLESVTQYRMAFKGENRTHWLNSLK